MLPRNRWFVVCALVYALAGGALGLAWLLAPASLPALAPRAHAHLMLVGFVGMMVFGIGLHILPRFTGHPLFSERMADVQFGFANLGLLLMVAGWLAGARGVATGGGVLVWGAFLMFAVNAVATVRPWARRG